MSSHRSGSLASGFARVLLCAGLAIASLSAHAVELTKMVQFDIPAQPLATALLRFAQQTDLQIVTAGQNVDGVKTSGVTGRHSVAAALKQVLAGTGFTFNAVGDGTVTVLSSSSGHVAADAAIPNENLRLVSLDEPTVGVKEGSENAKIEEIIVTAQKRSERLQDVPVPVTAINANVLIDSNQLRLQDYYTRIPGLNVAATPTYGGASIAIRGLSSGALTSSSSTVGIVVDDVQYSGSGQGLSSLIPEVDPTDIARIEVLRGPQGTLYGASSLGGLLKYVTVDPSAEGFSGRVRGGLSSIKNGDEAGYNVSASVNAPLGETWAARASGFTRRDPGFVDDPTHRREGVNRTQSSGGRLVTLWAPSKNFSLKLGALLQDNEVDGSTQVTLLPTSGDLQQNVLPTAGGFDKKIKIYTANLFAKFGSVELTAVSAYSELDVHYFLDLNPGGPATTALGALATSLYGVTGVLNAQSIDSNKFTEEVRLELPLGARVHWLLGGFYANDDKKVPTHQTARNFATGAEAGFLADFLITPSFEESSAFTNVTFEVTDRFDVQVGGRASRYKSRYKSDQSGPRFLNVTTLGPQLSADDDAFTYLVTPRFTMSPDLMLYARVASGYRSGGANTTLAPAGLPQTFDPDTTQNYEVGAKGSTLDGALSFDASVYYINWKDVQIPARDIGTGYGYVANAGRAKSQGVELSVESRPLTGLTLATWVAYNDAKLTENLPPTASGVFGTAGERLPLGARWSGNVSLDQEFPLMNGASGFLGGALSYVGDRAGSFKTSATARRPFFPSYTKIDLRAGVRYSSWEFNLFANNVTDKRAILDGDAALSPNFTFIQPRTFGLSASKDF